MIFLSCLLRKLVVWLGVQLIWGIYSITELIGEQGNLSRSLALCQYDLAFISCLWCESRRGVTAYFSIPGPSLVAHTVKNLPAMQETGFIPQVWKISWRRDWPPTPVFLPREFHEPGGLQSMGSESDSTETLSLFHFQTSARIDRGPGTYFSKNSLSSRFHMSGTAALWKFPFQLSPTCFYIKLVSFGYRCIHGHL